MAGVRFSGAFIHCLIGQRGAGKSGPLRRSARGQCRTAHKNPSHPQFWRSIGHQRHGRGFQNSPFIQAHHRMDDVGQFKYLHRRNREQYRCLAVSKGIAGTGIRQDRRFVARNWGALALTGMAFIHRHPAAHRSRQHECQQEKCEEMPKALHGWSGGENRRPSLSVKGGCLRCAFWPCYTGRRHRASWACLPERGRDVGAVF